MSKHPHTWVALPVMPAFHASDLRSIVRSVGRLGACALLAFAAGCGGGGDAAAPTATQLSPNPTVSAGASATVTGFSPSSASPGAVVTVTGTGLATVTSASVGSVPASFRIVSDTTVEVTVPNGASTGRIELGVCRRSAAVGQRPDGRRGADHHFGDADHRDSTGQHHDRRHGARRCARGAPRRANARDFKPDADSPRGRGADLGDLRDARADRQRGRVAPVRTADHRDGPTGDQFVLTGVNRCRTVVDGERLQSGSRHRAGLRERRHGRHCLADRNDTCFRSSCRTRPAAACSDCSATSTTRCCRPRRCR